MADKQINDWTVAVSWDLTDFNKAAKQVEKTLNRLFKMQNKVTPQLRGERPRGTSRSSVGGQSSSILTGERLLQKREVLLERINKLELKASSTLGKQDTQFKAIAKSAAKLRDNISQTVGSRNLSRLTRQVSELKQVTDGAARAANSHTRALRQQNFTTRSLTDSTRNLARSYISVFAAVEGGRSITNTATRFDSLDASMLAASGTATQAAADFEFIKKSAFEMGIGLEVVTDGFRQIGTAQRFSKVPAKEAQKQFSQMLKISRAFGLTTADTSLVLLAFQQMISKGTVSSEELRRQLGERLPGAVSVAARALNVTGEELSNMLKKGDVITTDFLPKFLNLYEQSVVESGAYAKSLKTITFAQSNLISQWQLMIKTISEAGGKDILITLFSNLSVIVGNLAPKLTLITNIFGGLAVAVAAFFAGFTSVTSLIFAGVNRVLGVLGSLLGVVIGPEGLITAFEALGIVVASVFAIMAVSKIGAVVGGVVAIVSQVAKLVVVLKEVRAVMAAITILTGLSTGGLSLIAGTAAIGAGLGVNALLNRNDALGASPALSGTTNNTTSNETNVGGITLNLNLPEGATPQDVEDISVEAISNRLFSSGAMPN
jgi:tape measure domain-containing protein